MLRRRGGFVVRYVNDLQEYIKLSPQADDEKKPRVGSRQVYKQTKVKSKGKDDCKC